MATALIDTPFRSLASIEPGERLEIQHLIFDAVRARCTNAGLLPGVAATCLAATDAHLLLELDSGKSVVFERQWARFVQVAA